MLKKKIPLYLHYYFSILRGSLSISIVMAAMNVTSNMMFSNLDPTFENLVRLALFSYLGCFFTLGTIFAIFLYHRNNRGEYYFFWNKNIHFKDLMIFTAGMNIPLLGLSSIGIFLLS